MSGTDPFEQIQVGQEAELSHLVSAEDLDTFARLTGDTNPLHVDEGFAATTQFRGRVVHGMLTASFISTIIGTKLPGTGALWYEQQLRFLSPVRVGEMIQVRARVLQKSTAQRIVTLRTDVFGEGGRAVIEGEGKVKLLEQPEAAPEGDAEDEQKGVVVVSGAGRGIGAAVARALAQQGFPVVVNYRSSEARARELAREIADQGGRAMPFRADVVDAQAVRRMVDLAVSEYGELAGVVNNAAPEMSYADFTDLTWDDMQAQLDVQLRGAFNLCSAAVPRMLEANRGSIVNISSIYADGPPPPRLAPYAVAKSSLAALTRALAAELGPHGIRVNTVSPGMTETDLLLQTPQKAKIMEKMRTPLRRLAQPEEIAGVVAFLFSEQSRHVSGENIRVCGGVIMS